LAGAVILWLLLWGIVPLASAQDVLMYRPLDNSDVVVTQPDIVFELEVTAFSTIRSVTVNGVAQSIKPGTFTVVKMPTHLHPGVNKFLVRVETDTGPATQTFEIQLVKLGADGLVKKKHSSSG